MGDDFSRVEEQKSGMEESLLRASNQPKNSEQILFSLNNRDKTHHYVKGSPISLFAPNISSFGGGQGDPWSRSFSIGLKNPYKSGKSSEQQKKIKKDLKVTQSYNDDKLEFISFTKIPCMALGLGDRLAQ